MNLDPFLRGEECNVVLIRYGILMELNMNLIGGKLTFQLASVITFDISYNVDCLKIVPIMMTN